MFGLKYLKEENQKQEGKGQENNYPETLPDAFLTAPRVRGQIRLQQGRVVSWEPARLA